MRMEDILQKITLKVMKMFLPRILIQSKNAQLKRTIKEE
jgi:hypothetical protein